MALKNQFKAKPDFYILGTQKAGTTTLSQYLIQHPEVFMPKEKEIHFFDIFYKKGVDWYKSFFPWKFSKKGKKVVGEASPFYFFHPLVAQRIRWYHPAKPPKFIVLLRNPIDRAFSHYNMVKEEIQVSFEEALKQEPQRLKADLKILKNDSLYWAKDLQDWSFVERGFYVQQMERWFQLFPKSSFLFLKSEDFFENPDQTLKSVSEFLNISSFSPKNKIHANQGKENQPLSNAIRLHLKDTFKAEMARLEKEIGISWAEFN